MPDEKIIQVKDFKKYFGNKTPLLVYSLDDSWTPEKYIPEPGKVITIDEKAKKVIVKMQRSAYIHALLNSHVLIINRAHFYINKAINIDFMKEDENYRALVDLLADKAIVPFLSLEPGVGHHKIQEGANIESSDYKDWLRFYENNMYSITTIRLSKNNNENTKLVNKLLRNNFVKFVKTMYKLDYEKLKEDFKLSGKQTNTELEKTFGDIAKVCNTTKDKIDRKYIYKKCFMANINYTYPEYSAKKLPYIKIAKLLIDLKYNFILSDAIKCYLLLPSNFIQRSVLQEKNTPISKYIPLTGEQIANKLFELQQISDNEIINKKEFPKINYEILSLKDVKKIRKDKYWINYMEKLELYRYSIKNKLNKKQFETLMHELLKTQKDLLLEIINNYIKPKYKIINNSYIKYFIYTFLWLVIFWGIIYLDFIQLKDAITIVNLFTLIGVPTFIIALIAVALNSQPIHDFLVEIFYTYRMKNKIIKYTSELRKSNKEIHSLYNIIYNLK